MICGPLTAYYYIQNSFSWPKVLRIKIYGLWAFGGLLNLGPLDSLEDLDRKYSSLK